METEKKRKLFTMKTPDGSWRLLAVFVALIMLFSFFANLIESNGYKVAVSSVTIDARGADLTMEVYKPTGVSSSQKLPCVLVTHGGSESLAACSLVSWEMARRGFVVIAVSAYGCGASQQPAIFENGSGGSPYNRGGTQGMYDALQYARSIAYVDKNRIGMWAHSAGRHLIVGAITQDNEFFTMNDRMLNVLYDTFKIKISADQVTKNADDIAKAQLSASQLAVYNFIKTEQQQIYDGYVKAARTTERAFGVTVTVAGNKVKRDPQVNLMIGLGTHEVVATTGIKSNFNLGESDQYKGIFHTGKTAVARNGWYNICNYTIDPNATSTLIGQCYDISAASNAALKAAIDNRSARLFHNPETMHNGNLWGWSAVSEMVEFFTQALGYNNGNLSDKNTQPIASKNLTNGYVTLALTTLSLFAMIGMIMALASVLLKGKFFAVCARTPYQGKLKLKSWNFVIAAALSTIAGFAGAYLCSLEDTSFTWSNATMTKFLPWEPGQMRTFMIIGGTALVGLVLFIIFALINKKRKDTSLATLSDVNIKLGWIPVLKTILLCLILFATCYISLAFIKGIFQVRFQSVDVSFELMYPAGFARMFKYALILLPFALILSTLNNMISLKGVSEGKDTFITTSVATLGAAILLVIGFIVTYSTPQQKVFFAIHAILSLIILVPITNYILRKMFKLTGSVWAGAIMLSLILGWRLSSYLAHQFMFYGPNQISAFWGIY